MHQQSSSSALSERAPHGHTRVNLCPLAAVPQGRAASPQCGAQEPRAQGSEKQMDQQRRARGQVTSQAEPAVGPAAAVLSARSPARLRRGGPGVGSGRR